MKVLWTDSALAQLHTIYDYLAQTSPEYARRIIDRLTKRSIQIARFPLSGRMVEEYELSEVGEVVEGTYRHYLLDRSRSAKGRSLSCYPQFAGATEAVRVSRIQVACSIRDFCNRAAQ